VYDMSDPAKLNPDPAAQQPDLGRRRFWQGVLTGGAGAALASLGFSAFAHGGPRHGGGFAMGGRGSPEAMLERAEFASDWMLTKVGASDAQKEQMRAIVRRTLAQLAPLRREHRAHRRAFMETLAAPSVDTARLAELRGAELKLADQASQALLEGATDAANVLSPEQRRQVVAMMQRHRGDGPRRSREGSPGGETERSGRTS
jgi:Spy/CpxP family protein refolding chaperone